MTTNKCVICSKSSELKYCSRECKNKSKRIYYEANKDAIKQKDKERYWSGGKEKSNQQSKDWYNRNKKKRAEYTKQYREKQKELFAKYKDLERFGGQKQNVLDRDDNKCVLCKVSERLVIHHIDGSGGSSRKGYININNSLENLITLCYKCHQRTHSYQNRIKNTFQSVDDIVRTMPKVIEEYVTMFPPRKKRS